MTTFTHAVAGVRRDERLLRTHLIWTGVSGLASLGMLGAFLAASSHLGADPLASSAPRLAASLAARTGASTASETLAVSALSYVPLVVFFASLHAMLRRTEESGIAAAVVAIAAPLFLAGAMAGDGFSLAVVVAQHSVGSLRPSVGVARVLGAGWRVCLTEAHVALAVVCGIVGATFLRAPGPGAIMRMPRWVGLWGVLGAAAVVPLVVDPGAMPVFVASNLLRFGWILVLSVSSLVLARRLGRRVAA